MNTWWIKGMVVFLLLGSMLCFSNFEEKEDWGFYGHRRINRLAVFTLPPEMISFYKHHIEYITEHAVDPDKRRYATKHEAHRHYIDIDHHGTYPFPELPRDWDEALMKYTDVFALTESGDTIQLFGNEVMETTDYWLTLNGPDVKKHFRKDSIKVYKTVYADFFKEKIMPQYYEDDWIVECEDLNKFFKDQPIKLNCKGSYAKDELSGYGIIPWHLEKMYLRLVKAFKDKNAKRILQLSADFGHYVGDSHVPLHTTTNYNGQLTDQVGIHGFWESRLVELFSDEFDFFVGPADYMDYPSEKIWETVLRSHILVDSVLQIEKRLSQTFPQDQQFCYEQRLDLTVRTQCKDYAKAYHDQMRGMVEERFTKSIHTLGSFWYSAWIDAGQPNLKSLIREDVKKSDKEQKEQEEIEKKFNDKKIIGRQHDG